MNDDRGQGIVADHSSTKSLWSRISDTASWLNLSGLEIQIIWPVWRTLKLGTKPSSFINLQKLSGRPFRKRSNVWASSTLFDDPWNFQVENISGSTQYGPPIESKYWPFSKAPITYLSVDIFVRWFAVTSVSMLCSTSVTNWNWRNERLEMVNLLKRLKIEKDFRYFFFIVKGTAEQLNCCGQ